MKIVFIIPEYLSGRSFLQPPVDILVVSEILEQDGWKTYLIDNRIEKLTLTKLIKKIEKITPNVLLVTTSPYDVSQNYFIDFRIYVTEKTIYELKKHFKNIPLIVVGSHGTVREDILLKDTRYSPDIIIKWEYEIILCKVLEILKKFNFNIRKAKIMLKKLPNLVIIDKKNNKYENTRYSSKLAHPLNFPIVPNIKLIKKYKHNYFGDKYINGKHMKVNKWGVVLFQRGCPFHCAFCFKLFGKSVRLVNKENKILESVSRWVEFGYNNLFVLDYTFGLSRNHLQIYQKLSKEFPEVNFYLQTRADLITKRNINEYKKININFIWVGIESFSNCIQKIISKYNSVRQIISAIKLLEKNEISYGGFIQFGLPGETIKTINKNLYYIWKLKIPYTKSIILHTPLYGTRTYSWAKKQYPWIGKNWSDISTIRGLVQNDMTPGILLKLVDFLRSREIFEYSNPPQIDKILNDT